MVPGHIELAGYDKIRYINTMYPWKEKSTTEEHIVWRQPEQKKECSQKHSTIRQALISNTLIWIRTCVEKRIYICFEGVEEAMYLWLNGQFIGYAEDSFTPSEFDLTPYIREKGNVLAVQVHKMSTAAFLEDQDFFRFFGIFRNVTLKAIPDVHLEVCLVQTSS